ncbi:MAG: glycosyltransferase family 2 protein [Lachnospiraceae bacterium]|nr:glycosyltransferase family 2 protein [Lachnospiraceae bacterium]
MLVSIVIPVYNTSKYLSQCLNSVINQTYKSLEIICVDDGSTDNSLSILKEYADKDSRIRIFTKKNEGKGAASARNLGLSNATGDYILFLDSDDFFEPNMVEDVVNKAEEKDADVVIYKAQWFDDKQSRVTKIYEPIELQNVPANDPFCYKDIPDKIFQIGDLIAWNKMYKMDLIREYDLKFESIPISDDQYLPALAMVFAKRITYVDRIYVNYRFNTGSSQCDSQTKHPEAAYAATYSIVSKMREYGIYDEVKRSYINMALRLMREYFDKMVELTKIKELYDKYNNEIFEMLGAVDLSENYFYDYRIGQWYSLITTNSLEEILFKTSRAYGSKMTTAIMRFQFPYDEVEQGAKIVLVGKGMIGKYWYAQILLADYANVVAWVASEEEIPDDFQDYQKIYAR